MITVVGFIVGFTVLGSIWWAYRRFVLVNQHLHPGARRPLSFWRRMSGSKEYELVAVHPA